MSKIKILVADDEARMRKLIADFLKKEGYEIYEADNGRETLGIFEGVEGIDLVILDVMMPEIDGWSVCKEIRKNSQIPVIMLTARSTETDEVYGFNIGADEYITKPFSPLILTTRVQALLRRSGGSKRLDEKVCSGIRIDSEGHGVYIDGVGIDLSPKEFELLGFLVENEGLALTREQILNSVWDYDYFGDARTVDTHIKKLRLKLGDKGDLINTIRGVGYKFGVKK